MTEHTSQSIMGLERGIAQVKYQEEIIFILMLIPYTSKVNNMAQKVKKQRSIYTWAMPQITYSSLPLQNVVLPT